MIDLASKMIFGVTKYSHDILRGDLEGIGVTVQLMQLAKRKTRMLKMP